MKALGLMLFWPLVLGLCLAVWLNGTFQDIVGVFNGINQEINRGLKGN